jgi:small GTP-binding protein
MEGNQILVKLLSIGDKEVGKSCIIKRYCEGRFVQKYITTIGVDYGVKKMTISGKKIAVNFFDLSGDDDYALIRNPFLKDAQVRDGRVRQFCWYSIWRTASLSQTCRSGSL